jgi:hypothetical protein
MHKSELKIRPKLRVFAAIVFSSFQLRNGIDSCVEGVFSAVVFGSSHFGVGSDGCVSWVVFF